MQKRTIDQAIQANRAYYCLDCGKCTSVCPISWRDSSFSPRALVEAFKLDGSGAVLSRDAIWACLTCGRCTQICPSGVHFLTFVQDARALARDACHEGHCSHGATIQTWMRMMAQPGLRQDRLGWLTEDLRVSEDSDTVYFVGCLPYYQAMFANIDVQALEIAQGAVRILNHLGIEPIVMADERCCGHDLLWEGEKETFEELRTLNTRLLQQTGAKRIVTTCPECARTLQMDYRLNMEVVHMAQLIAERGLPVTDVTSGKVTYHDPCRLGRHLGVYDEPRRVIDALGYELLEMPHNRERAICCGTSAWTHCGATAKAIQVDRLREASGTGAETLVTSCVKCQIHFTCAQQDPRLDDALQIEIRDLTALVAQTLEVSSAIG